MDKVGYAIFGRPSQHYCKSFGLFKAQNLGKDTYLQDLPDGFKPEVNEELIVIKRGFLSSDLHYTVVLKYRGVHSHNKRPGGFVGYGLAFLGYPTSKLLGGVSRFLEDQANKLVNKEDHTFKEANDEKWNIKFPKLETEELVKSIRLPSYPVDSNPDLLAIKVEGALNESLSSCALGFILNKSLSKGKLFVASRQNSVLKTLNSDFKINVINSYRLLDFSKEYSIREEKKNKINGQIRELTNMFNKRKSDLTELKSEYEKQLHIKSQLVQQEKEKTEKLNDIDRRIFAKEEDYRRIVQTVKNEEKKSNNIKNINQKSFEAIINSEEFKLNKEEYLSKLKSKWAQKIRAEQDFSSEVFEKNGFRWGRVSTAALVLIALGFLLGWVVFSSSPERTVQAENQSSEVSLVSLPPEIKPKDYLNITKSEKTERFKQIASFLEQNPNSIELTDRNWYFRELFDVIPENNLLSKVYESISKEKSKAQFFIPKLEINGSIIPDTIKLAKGSVEDKLGIYIKRPNNIYREEFGKEKEVTSEMIKNDEQLKLHFEWLLKKLNPTVNLEDEENLILLLITD